MRINTENFNPSFKANPFPSDIAKNFSNQLLSKDVKTIDLFCHNSPDEDTVNAMKVMYNWLKSHGKKVKACLNTFDIAGLNFNKLFYKIKKDNVKPDKSICLDFNATERIPHGYNLKENNDVFVLDHHTKSNTTIKSSNLYIDDSSYSCCGVVYRFFESLGKKLNKRDLKSLYCGLLSDYKSSKLVSINNCTLIKQPSLLEDKNSLDVLNKIENSLSEKDKNKIYKHLDIMSKLNKNEKRLMKELPEQLSVSNNLAYIFIDPKDKLWEKVGFENVKTSAILKEIRTRAINNFPEDDMFSKRQKELLEKVKAVAIFYSTGNNKDAAYQVSIHSKDGYAEKLINKVKDINFDFSGGGHPDRAGGRIHCTNFNDAVQMVEDFIRADLSFKS